MPARKKTVPASDVSPPPAGDTIKVNTRGDGNVIAAGRRAIAAVFHINIGEVKWQPVVIVLLLVGGLLAVILYYVIPKTSGVMEGQFNVAVAGFQVKNASGAAQSGNDGHLLAEYVTRQIDTQFKGIQLEESVPYEVWGPDRVKPVPGKTPEERRKAAAELAERIHAHVLIYGNIEPSNGRSYFAPEFYINHRGFWQASEITGAHPIGSKILVALPLNASIPSIENPALAGRVNALDLITIGLAYYTIDDYQNAARYFEQAVAEPRWLDSCGKEVGYLLLGNAYTGRASKEDDGQYLPLGKAAYNEATRINENYGRGWMGLAGVLYLEGLGSLQQVQVDPAKLDEAEVYTQRVLAMPDQPESANLPVKAHFNLGQIALARYKAQAPGQDWLEQAGQEFRHVTGSYEAGNATVETFASHAYYRLGVITYLQNKTDQAVEQAVALIKKGISIAPPFYQGEFTIMLANIYKNTAQVDLAMQACQEAIAIAEANGDAQHAAQYQACLQAVSQP